MIYQLPNGKTIYIDIEIYLKMSDADFQYLNENNFGSNIENPFDCQEDSSDDLLFLDDDLFDLPDDTSDY